MTDENVKGLQTQNLPWLTRVLVHAIFDSLAEEREALRQIGAPSIDAFVDWDSILVWTYVDKKVEALSRHLKGEKVNPNSVEYEIAYLRNREPLRVRVSRLNMNDLVINADREGERSEGTVP